jgi:hypothetical protein
MWFIFAIVFARLAKGLIHPVNVSKKNRVDIRYGIIT